MIVSCDEMKALEAKAFAAGITAESLMNEAGLKIAQAVRQFFPAPGRCILFFGKGHNGGDALVAARHLVSAGWSLELQSPFPESEWAELTTKKYHELQAHGVHHHETPGAHDFHRMPCVVLDGLLGIGVTGALRSPLRSCTMEINQRRRLANAQVFAIDLPTGLNGDTGEADGDCVVADFTLAIGFAKKGLLADKAADFTGRLAVLPLTELSSETFHGGIDSAVATADALAPLLPRRKFDTHKGDYGRIGIVAGSIGATGAAVMSAGAAVRAGAGLISLFVTPDVYPIVAGACMPEVMVRPVSSFHEVLKANLDVIAIGPGIGSRDAPDFLDVIEKAPQSMVVDADALNILSTNTGLLNRCAGKRLLTPHPGEMSRLFDTENRPRHEIAREFTERFPVALLFKGSRTIVAEHGSHPSYNITGSPGMATGGMGDVLTGVCAALLGQGLSCYDAGRVGAWICGRAAEIAIFQGGQSVESLVATDLLAHMGAAFKELRARCY